MDFSIRIVRLYQYLDASKVPVMGKQLLRCGTSIGANIAEACRAESPQDFVHKLGISRKEGEETLYWLELLHRTGYISTPQHNSVNADCEELMRLLTSIIKTTRKNITS